MSNIQERLEKANYKNTINTLTYNLSSISHKNPLCFLMNVKFIQKTGITSSATVLSCFKHTLRDRVYKFLLVESQNINDYRCFPRLEAV